MLHTRNVFKLLTTTFPQYKHHACLKFVNHYTIAAYWYTCTKQICTTKTENVLNLLLFILISKVTNT